MQFRASPVVRKVKCFKVFEASSRKHV